jgi:hypothetical protein
LNDDSADARDRVTSCGDCVGTFMQTPKLHCASRRLCSSNLDASDNCLLSTADDVETDVNNVDATEYFRKYDDVIFQVRNEIMEVELKHRYTFTDTCRRVAERQLFLLSYQLCS